MPIVEMSSNVPALPISYKKRLTRPVTAEQITDAVKEWAIRFNQKKTVEEAAMLATLYYEDLTYQGVSETEFELLKKEINMTCRFFPTVAEILSARRIFYEGRFIPTDEDRKAALVDPNYQHGKERYVYNTEMVEAIERDYEDKPAISGGYGKLLKSI